MLRFLQSKRSVLPTHAPSKNAPAIKAMIGSLAPQGINVVVIMVILRSLSFSIVLEAMIPGTPHPLPISIGMKDFPERPNLRKILSMIKATRAIYPHDSRNARKINNTSICGTKPKYCTDTGYNTVKDQSCQPVGTADRIQTGTRSVREYRVPIHHSQPGPVLPAPKLFQMLLHSHLLSSSSCVFPCNVNLCCKRFDCTV